MRKPPKRRTPERSEAEILADLAALCSRPGFVHALAALCYRDNVILYGDTVKEGDLKNLFAPEHLSRGELQTLQGLMVKAPIDWTLPAPADMQDYIDTSDRLLLELHHALSEAFSLKKAIASHEEGGPDPFDRGEAMREPIFYASESAYDFQYLDLAGRKYAADADWLALHRGFTIEQARDVVQAVSAVGLQALAACRVGMRSLPPDQWTVLPGFTVSLADVAAAAGLPPALAEHILMAFTLPEGARNDAFVGLHDFNAVTETPLLRHPNGDFVCLQHYCLTGSLYESPFFWMHQDEAYRQALAKHRGDFAEQFVAERLAHVFGAERVFVNVDQWQGKTRVGEIDVLVLWADRAIVVQAKSKRLTLEARKGNDRVIRDDFQKAVQAAYDQGLACAQRLGDGKSRLALADGREVALPGAINEIFVFCVLSDHYPGLSFQTRQFLKPQDVPRVRAALVTDVFLIDVLTEFLSTPLHFLSYVARRVRYADKLLAAHELTILAYHLRQNLWFEPKFDLIHLPEDHAVALDIAMAARRRGLEGNPTPEGILTRWEGTTLGAIVEQLQARPQPATLEFGFQLLELDEPSIHDVSRMIDRLLRSAAQDGRPHNMTLGFGDGSGITVHVSDLPTPEAAAQLRAYCVRRKYAQHADRWFGLTLSAAGELRFGVTMLEPWAHDPAMDEATAGMAPPMKPAAAYEKAFRGGRSQPDVGRNDPCPCGSGRKFKKCCLP